MPKKSCNQCHEFAVIRKRKYCVVKGREVESVKEACVCWYFHPVKKDGGK